MSPVVCTFVRKLLKIGEMLIRLPFPVVDSLEGGFPISPQMINMVNISPDLSTIWKNWLPPPFKKLLTQKIIQRNSFWGHCNNSAKSITQKNSQRITVSKVT